MSRKLRTPKRQFEEITPTELWVMGNRTLYGKPQEVKKWELLDLDCPTARWKKCKELWESCRDLILEDWIKVFPGTRPSWWWLFDGPRMSKEELKREGWHGDYYAHQLAAPRKRLGGIGTPDFEVLIVTPCFLLGVPENWEYIDPQNPPKFESQTTYLKRHGLL